MPDGHYYFFVLNLFELVKRSTIFFNRVSVVDDQFTLKRGLFSKQVPACRDGVAGKNHDVHGVVVMMRQQH